jgi:hypothetical protein
MGVTPGPRAGILREAADHVAVEGGTGAEGYVVAAKRSTSGVLPATISSAPPYTVVSAWA